MMAVENHIMYLFLYCIKYKNWNIIQWLQILVTNSMEQNPSFKASSCQTIKEMVLFFMEANIHSNLHNSSSLDSILRQIIHFISSNSVYDPF